jgi:hypothetical protein
MKNINISKNSQYNYVCITYVELYIGKYVPNLSTFPKLIHKNKVVTLEFWIG